MNAPLRPSYPPEVTLNPRIDPTEQAEVAAEQERKRLGLGDQPVIYLRNTLEWHVGLRIFYSSELPSNIAGMYAYSGELGGVHPDQPQTPAGAAAGLDAPRVRPLPPEQRSLQAGDRLPGDRRPQAGQRAVRRGVRPELPHARRVRPAGIPEDRGDDRRLPGRRPLPHEALLLRVPGGDDPAGRATGPDPQGDVGAPEGVEIRPAQGGGDARPAHRTPINDSTVPERYRYLAVHAYERDEIWATPTSPITCGATSSRPARSSRPR